MSGIHGKNATLRISTTETAVTALETLSVHPDATLAAAGAFEAANKNWKFAPRGDTDAALVQYDVTGPITKFLDSNSEDIHYAEGAVLIPAVDFPNLIASSVKATYTHLEMETVGNLTTDDRSAEINVETEEVDTTTLGERYKTSVEGIPEWSGTLDGLYLSPERYKLAVSRDGLIPRKILRIQPRPDKDTYWQGTVTFPNYSFSLAHDAAVEKSIDFTGQGPLDLVQAGLPVFPRLI